MKCPNCEKELVNLVGKRQKQFCNSTCRSNYWQKKKREEKFEKKVEKVINKVLDDTKNKKEIKKSTDSLIETGFWATETSIKKGKITIKDQSEPKPGSLAHYIKYGN